MLKWISITAAAASALILLIIVVVVLRRRRAFSGQSADIPKTRAETLQSGISKLHVVGIDPQLNLDSKGRQTYHVFRRGISSKPLFHWGDHPWLVTEAVENGWSRFAFTVYTPSPSTRSSLLRLCAAGDGGRETQAQMSWELCEGSADFMQKIRLNPNLKKINYENIPLMVASSVIRTALPLPGPPLGNSSFPQEAYFEITILSSGDSVGKVKEKRREGERAKLIQDQANSNGVANSDSLIHVTSSKRGNKLGQFGSARGDSVTVAVGLAGGGALPMKLPGSYPGSIGFNSSGSVFLDGMKLVDESEKAEWGTKDKVIGSGYDPARKKVFFTVDSELVHVINCKSEEFGAPLYPILAANVDVTFLVNLGQSAFLYAPANAQRTQNPCFIRPHGNSPAALGYDDSRELFSMGRIDSQWLNRSTTKGSHANGGGTNNNRAESLDDDFSDADLFEIVLDSSGRSPNMISSN